MLSEASNPEFDLVDKCLEGDSKAQYQLYNKYKDAMFTLCYRISGDFDLAADILQEGFVKVFRGLKSFRRESTLGAWIKTIIIRTAYNAVKKQKVFFEPIENVGEEDVIQWGDFLQAEYLEKAILSLPDGYRMVFTMIEVEGYSHKEVAEMLNISVGTSKSQLFYAKRKLRDLLKHQI
jgi:RNA polymerase sigma factor (sigma-70 family)